MCFCCNLFDCNNEIGVTTTINLLKMLDFD